MSSNPPKLTILTPSNPTRILLPPCPLGYRLIITVNRFGQLINTAVPKDPIQAVYAVYLLKNWSPKAPEGFRAPSSLTTLLTRYSLLILTKFVPISGRFRNS